MLQARYDSLKKQIDAFDPSHEDLERLNIHVLERPCRRRSRRPRR